jgi:micrococcal nuclease
MDAKLYWYRGVVIKVVDGDTVDVEIDLGMNIYTRQRLRLSGVNTPEIFGVKEESEEYARGMQAKIFVEERLLNKTVWFHTLKDKTGKYGRYLAEIYFQDDDGVHVAINKLLLEDGLAEECE